MITKGADDEMKVKKREEKKYIYLEEWSLRKIQFDPTKQYPGKETEEEKRREKKLAKNRALAYRQPKNLCNF